MVLKHRHSTGRQNTHIYKMRYCLDTASFKVTDSDSGELFGPEQNQIFSGYRFIKQETKAFLSFSTFNNQRTIQDIKYSKCHTMWSAYTAVGEIFHSSILTHGSFHYLSANMQRASYSTLLLFINPKTEQKEAQCDICPPPVVRIQRLCLNTLMPGFLQIHLHVLHAVLFMVYLILN